MTRPWRKVIHIDTTYREGRSGRTATIWFLTLECGHSKSIHGGTFIFHRDIFKKVRTAPKRVRCLLCDEEDS